MTSSELKATAPATASGEDVGDYSPSTSLLDSIEAAPDFSFLRSIGELSKGTN